MFEKRCNHCDKKIERNFDFCPYCGVPTKNLQEEYGLLGKSDKDSSIQGSKSNNFGFMDKLIGSAVNSAMKMFEKELQDIEKKKQSQPKIGSNLQLYINGKRIPIENQQNIEKPIKQKKEEAPKVSEETIEKSKKLPRKEAKTKLTRLKDKVVYELDTPGLNSLNNVLINNLENSLEIKAYTERAVYIKTLKVKLPLQSYAIKQDKLFLEFGTGQ